MNGLATDRNACKPIESTLSGIVIELNEKAASKALLPILVNPDPRFRVVNTVDSRKASASIEVTEFGIVSDVREFGPAKA